MATTTYYSWTTPDDTALVKDGAAAIRSLGSAIDSTLKTQIDAQIPDALLTTKGDLIAATGASTPARLAVGTNGQVLTADSTAATGVKWSGGGSINAVYPSKPTSGSVYYMTAKTSNTLSTTTSQDLTTVSLTHYVPIYVGSITASRIGVRTQTTFTGVGVTMRLGIYNNDATLNIPTTVLLDAGQITPSAANTNYEITIYL